MSTFPFPTDFFKSITDPTFLSLSFPQPTHVVHSYASATVAVLVGGALAYLYTRHLEKKKSQRDMLAEFSDDLKAIQNLCEEYWLGDHKDTKEAPKLIKAGHILGAKILATTEYRPLIKKLMKNSYEDFESLDVRLFMLATGGNFQTNKMAASPQTYAEISSVIFKTELILRELRS